jgi:hypothetical protein
MQKIFILSIQFNKAYLLYVLESENASYWYVSKSIKGHASKSRGEQRERENVLYGKNIHCS